MTLSSIRDYCILPALVLALAGCTTPNHEPQHLSVAAAADLQFALEAVARDFRARNPRINLEVVYGSSGNFYTQIHNGAPFDVFLSADIQYPDKLIGEGLAVRDSRFLYAVGRIALWVPAHSSLDVAGLQMRALEQDSVKHIAIANPQHAPYGRAAEAALKSFGVYDHIAPKLVLGENIAQTLQFAQSGAADIGVVALSLALAPAVRGQGRYWEVPLSAYPTMLQGGVILDRAAHSRAAAEFRAYLMSRSARAILERYGFSIPSKS